MATTSTASRGSAASQKSANSAALKASAASKSKGTSSSGLKANNAGYSTTDRSGNTTYYKSPKDAPGYYDTFQGKGTTSAGSAMYTKDASGKVITPASLQTAPNPPTVPQPQTNGLTSDLVKTNNTALASGLSGLGYKYDSNGQFVQDTPKDTATSNLESYLKALQAPPSTSDIYNKEYKAAGIQQKQQSVNDYTAQLNAIVAKQQADVLSLTGQGRGVPEVIIGGQQAQINKEAAIKALPIQAQLAAAQDNLELAQTHLDTMFKIKSQDALAEYQFKSKIIDTYYAYASEQEKREFDSIKTEKAQQYDMKKTNLSLQNDWAKTAIEYGQSSLAGKLMQLDPSAADFQTKLAALQGQVYKPVAKKVASAPETKNFGTSDAPVWKQFDATTGSWVDVTGVGATGGSNNQPQLDRLNEMNDIVTGLLSPNAVGKSSAVGASLAKFVPFGQALGLQGSRTSFETRVDTLKNNLTLDNLKLLKGPMSDKDIYFLKSIGSSLNTGMSEVEFNKELEKVQTKLNTAITNTTTGSNVVFGIPRSSSGAPLPVLTGADGLQYIITDN